MDHSDAKATGPVPLDPAPSTPNLTPHCTAGGQSTTPVVKRRHGEGLDASEPRGHLKRRQLSLESAELRQKEEKLQKLQLVNHYRQNQSLSELAELIRCWREAAQQALTDLQQRLEERGQQTDIIQLLHHLGIAPQLVGYDPEEEDFLGLDDT